MKRPLICVVLLCILGGCGGQEPTLYAKIESKLVQDFGEHASICLHEINYSLTPILDMGPTSSYSVDVIVDDRYVNVYSLPKTGDMSIRTVAENYGRANCNHLDGTAINVWPEAIVQKYPDKDIYNIVLTKPYSVSIEDHIATWDVYYRDDMMKVSLTTGELVQD